MTERAFKLAELIDLLRTEVENEGGVAAWCDLHGIEPDVVSRLLAGGPGARLTQPVLDALDVEPIVRYRRITRPDPT